MKLARPSLLISGLMLFCIGLSSTIRSGFDRLAIFLGSTTVDTTLAWANFYSSLGFIAMVVSGLFIALAFSKEP